MVRTWTCPSPGCTAKICGFPLFAAEMREGSTTATFTLRDFPATASAEVLGETRTIAVTNGVFTDDFNSYDVHLYRITF